VAGISENLDGSPPQAPSSKKGRRVRERERGRGQEAGASGSRRPRSDSGDSGSGRGRGGGSGSGNGNASSRSRSRTTRGNGGGGGKAATRGSSIPRRRRDPSPSTGGGVGSPDSLTEPRVPAHRSAASAVVAGSRPMPGRRRSARDASGGTTTGSGSAGRTGRLAPVTPPPGATRTSGGSRPARRSPDGTYRQRDGQSPSGIPQYRRGSGDDDQGRGGRPSTGMRGGGGGGGGGGMGGGGGGMGGGFGGRDPPPQRPRPQTAFQVGGSRAGSTTTTPRGPTLTDNSPNAFPQRRGQLRGAARNTGGGAGGAKASMAIKGRVSRSRGGDDDAPLSVRGRAGAGGMGGGGGGGGGSARDVTAAEAPRPTTRGGTPVCFVCGARIPPGGAYIECPNGSVRHKGCPVQCGQCGRPTLQPRYYTGVPGSFCSEDCGARADPSSLRCSVCSDVIVGQFSKNPDGEPRHNGCAVACVTCGRRTTRPKYFKGIVGAFCSETCSARADPRSIRCCQCGDVIIGKYTVERAGRRKGLPLHNACV